MVICSFFLQGRCMFGDRCWNEHSRDGRSQGHNRYQGQDSAKSSSWNSSGQRYVQPPTSSKNITWTSRDSDRSSYGSGSSENSNRTSKSNTPSGFFTPQNRFNALKDQDHTGDTGQDKEGSLLTDIIKDLEMWESSGQWLLSVYCISKERRHLSGFTDISPEELRLECYTSHSEGHFQNYVSSVQQLVNQWKQRVQELKNWNPSSTSALLGQLIEPPTATAPSSFGGLQQSGSAGGLQQSGFGVSSTSADKTVTAATFSFKADSHPPPNAGATSSFYSAPAFNSKPSVGFGNVGTSSAPSFSCVPTTTSGGAASTFSGFGSATTSSTAVSGFGSSVSSGFGGTTVTGGFGNSVNAVSTFGGIPSTSGFGGLSRSTEASGFGTVTTGTGSYFTPGTSSFGQRVTESSSSNAVRSSATDTMLSTALHTPRNEFSQEDLLQFESKMFTLGKVPLMPPPVDLLTLK